ncbi:M4 family metallopeptidase [Brumimicrobium aurantiacum]|uniref:Neutral metalloproteinase n=1 Tax=Brumimicrobium aurantiacum TaxID=1737063 RepID=A0A3E1F1N8_9FLAO|nr:M4 family metallopeptidase [Brumimicrobium aurantiacum]RFC55663.1 T9SS C-terminal target domain-containing protein [Brumimicrobium aurantiacum]
MTLFKAGSFTLQLLIIFNLGMYQLYRQNAPDLNNNMVLTDSHVDSLVGFTHHKYQQTYMDLPIEGAGCIEHYEPNGSLNFINAKIADSIKKSHIPSFGKEEAVKYLIDQLRKEKIVFAWEDEDWEHQIQLDEHNGDATWYPEPELIWAVDTMKNMNMIISGDRYTLAYKMSIKIIEPEFETFIYYVDANTGDILKFHSTHICNGPAEVDGYGFKTIDTDWKGGFTMSHILRANDDTRNIHTKENPGGSSPWFLTSETTDDDDDWGWSHLTETSTHFHVSNSWDYFRQTFAWTGLNGIGSEIRVRANWDYPNAEYRSGETPRELAFGRTSAYGEQGREPSVVGHEYTHGVTDYTAGLESFNESGALNESFSDIFGIVIQATTLDGGYTDWIYGNFVPSDVEKTRSLKDPKSRGEHFDNNGNLVLGQPDTYQGQYWYDGNNNNGGVHVNSGVQNKWFYVLAHGDNGTNDLNDYYNVDGIGMSKTIDIVFLSLVHILDNSSQYSDSRQATIKAAKIMFGECSVEHQATIDAWYAVGIGSLNDCEYTLSNDNIGQLEAETLVFPNPASNILTIQVPDKVDDNIKIFDATGKIIESFNDNNLVFSKDVSSLSNGVYFINFSINGNPIRKRFIIQK